MKKFLLVIAVLVMSATAYAADTLTTFGEMESIYVYQGVEYVGPFFRGWKSYTGQFPYLVPADSVHFVSPNHSARLLGWNTPRDYSVTKNVLRVPAVHGPGTYQIHLMEKIKRVNLYRDQYLYSAVFVRGWSDSNGTMTWSASRYDTVYDTLWHTIDGDLMTITLAAGDSFFHAPDTTSQINVGCNATNAYPTDTLCVDDVYLTGIWTPGNGVEEGPAEPKKNIRVSGLRPGIYDLLGRRVDLMEHSGIYFVVGRDGSRTKVVHFR